jgi:hypothetical protein
MPTAGRGLGLSSGSKRRVQAVKSKKIQAAPGVRYRKALQLALQASSTAEGLDSHIVESGMKKPAGCNQVARAIRVL